MRDITFNGPVGGENNTFNFNDQHQQEGPKLLINCTNEELFDERTHRQRFVAQVESKRHKVMFGSIVALLINMLVNTLINKFEIETGLGASLFGFIFLIAPLIIMVNVDKIDTEFMQRQQQALKEIYLILRERGII